MPPKKENCSYLPTHYLTKLQQERWGHRKGLRKTALPDQSIAECGRHSGRDQALTRPVQWCGIGVIARSLAPFGLSWSRLYALLPGREQGTIHAAALIDLSFND